MSVEVAALEPSACLTLEVGESMNAQMTPVHSVFYSVRVLLSVKLDEMELTKSDENKVCRPRDSAS